MGGVFLELLKALIGWIAANPDQIGGIIKAIINAITNAKSRAAVRELMRVHASDADARALVDEVMGTVPLPPAAPAETAA